MEFDSNGTKYMFIGIAIAFVIGFGFILNKIIQQDRAYNTRIEQERSACKDLNLRYGDTVKVKEGFFRGLEGTAVGRGMGHTSIKVQYMEGLKLSEDYFECSLLETVR